VAASTSFGGVGYASGMSMGGQAKIQLIGVAVVVAWSAIGSIAILFAVKRLIGLRASGPEVEDGLDLSHHGERAYSP